MIKSYSILLSIIVILSSCYGIYFLLIFSAFYFGSRRTDVVYENEYLYTFLIILSFLVLLIILFFSIYKFFKINLILRK